jgi:hypothetical protein
LFYNISAFESASTNWLFWAVKEILMRYAQMKGLLHHATGVHSSFACLDTENLALPEFMGLDQCFLDKNDNNELNLDSIILKG